LDACAEVGRLEKLIAGHGGRFHTTGRWAENVRAEGMTQAAQANRQRETARLVDVMKDWCDRTSELRGLGRCKPLSRRPTPARKRRRR
jgi:hypothetical protein